MRCHGNTAQSRVCRADSYPVTQPQGGEPVCKPDSVIADFPTCGNRTVSPYDLEKRIAGSYIGFYTFLHDSTASSQTVVEREKPRQTA